jgi:hypothetical protein
MLLVDCCMSLVAQQNSNVTTVFLIETAAQLTLIKLIEFKNSLSQQK